MSQEKAPLPAPDAEARTAVAGAGADWGALIVERRRGDPRKLKRQGVNARFMTKGQMAQLIANIRRDGVMTSLPLCYDDPDQAPGKHVDEILSGHHRVEAAVGAELAEIDYLCIVSKLSEERKRAIQLSHNALVGQDDGSVLASMYADLDLGARLYSGLDDAALGLSKSFPLAGLSLGVKYKDLTFHFLPEDEAVVASVMKTLEAHARKQQAYVAAYADFDAFFDVMLRTKAKFQVFNNALALRMLVDLATERLDQLEAPADDQAA